MISGLHELWRAMGAGGENRKSRARQLADMVWLLRARDIGPRYYLVAGMNRRGLSRAEMADYINEAEYLDYILRINPKDGRRPLYEKPEQKRRFRAFGLATPEPIFMTEGGPVDFAAFAEALATCGIDHVAVKPADSFGGQGFRPMRILPGPRLIDDKMADAEPQTLEDVAATMPRGFIVEPYLTQHDWYASLNPDSVNAWRIWAIQAHQNAEPEIVLSYLRMGRTGIRTDNVGGGGLYAALRPDGTLEPGRTGTIFRKYLPRHPDTGIQIEDARPPFAEEAKALARTALAQLRELRFAGFDIAVTPEGPTILEVNAEPDRRGQAYSQVPFKRWLRDHRIEY